MRVIDAYGARCITIHAFALYSTAERLAWRPPGDQVNLPFFHASTFQDFFNRKMPYVLLNHIRMVEIMLLRTQCRKKTAA